MKIKIYQVFAAIMAAVILSVSISDCYYRPLYVKAAMLPASIELLEVLEWVLLSVGTTVLGVELVEQSDADAVTAIQELLDGFESGLGAEVVKQCQYAVLANSKSVTLSRKTWDSLRDWSEATFEGKSEVDLKGISGSGTANITSFNELYGAVMSSVGIGFADNVYNQFVQFYDGVPSGRVFTVCLFENMGGNDSKIVVMAYDPSSSVPYVRNDSTGVFLEFAKSFSYFSAVTASSDKFINSGFASAPEGSYKIARYQQYPSLTWTFPIVSSEVQIRTKLKVNRKYYEDVVARHKVLVTPGTSYKDKELLGDVTLPFPADLTKALQDALNDVISIPDILEDVNVYPVDDSPDAIEDAISKVQAAVKEIEQYRLSLAEFFPFCIPFDFVDFINVLKADPVAPEFTFKFPVGYDLDQGVIYQDYTISLSQFDQVAYWCRQFELLAFIIGLIIMTRPMFIKS